VIEAIEELDLEDFYASYRVDGHGRAAHDPKMMLTLVTGYSVQAAPYGDRSCSNSTHDDQAAGHCSRRSL
jgi:hypothetical protein